MTWCAISSVCPPARPIRSTCRRPPFCSADRLVIYDHVKHRLLVVVHSRSADPQSEATAEAQAASDEIVARLRRPLPLRPAPTEPSPQASIEEFASACSRETYEAAVTAARNTSRGRYLSGGPLTAHPAAHAGQTL